MARPNFTTEELEFEIQNGYISKRKHPTEDLWIFNYTPKNSHEWRWNKITKQCRGLIVDKDFNIVSRPFEKFFSVEQLGEEWNSPDGPVRITRKMDGSLGISYWVDNRPYLATRGSFESEQAKVGNELLHTWDYSYILNKNFTYLFEIIYPDNRIVVNYGDEAKIILLAIVDTELGNEYFLPTLENYTTEVFPNLTFTEALQKNEPNKEGYVCHFLSTGERVKIKNEWYKQNKWVIRNITPTKMVRDFIEKTHETLWNKVQESPNWIKNYHLKIENQLNVEFWKIEEYCDLSLEAIKRLTGKYSEENSSRKELAHYIKKTEFPGIIFGLLDSKDVDNYIWKEVEKKLKEKENNVNNS